MTRALAAVVVGLGVTFSPVAATQSRSVGDDAARADLSGQTQPAISAAQRLAGAWQLESRTVRRPDGTVISDPVLGERPLGRLLYDASGVVMLQMMRLDRAAAIGTPADAKDRANPRVVLGYDAYFGRYSVDERAGTITHRVEGSLFPEDLGKDFVRGFKLDGDALTLEFTSAAGAAQLTRTLTFRRMR